MHGWEVKMNTLLQFHSWWFEEHDIAYNENLLTNMATGYCQVSSHREMPTTKIEAYKASKKNKK